MSDDRVFGVLDRALARSRVPETEMLLQAGRSEVTRFAGSQITQSLSEETVALSLRTAFGRRTARVTTDRLGDDTLDSALDACAALARVMPEDPDLLPLPGPQEAPDLPRCHEATASLGPEVRARAVRDVVGEADLRGLELAGVFANGVSTLGAANSRGLVARHRETHAEFSVTALSSHGASGWAKATDTDVSRIDVRALARKAMDRAEAGRDPRELAPGAYTVVLEPAAVLDLLGFLFFEWGGQAVTEQRSFLTGKVGERLFGGSVTIVDDVAHPLQSGAPWDGEGMPRRMVTLVEKGVVKGLVYARSSAAKAGVEPTGHGFPVPNEWGEMPVNIVMQGGPTPIEEMIATTDRGVLVTRFWYIRDVDPMSKLLTGLTRDGTFLIEGGEVRRAVRNLRFNESVVGMLNEVEAMGPAVRASGEESFDMVVPPLKVRGFHFTGSA